RPSTPLLPRAELLATKRFASCSARNTAGAAIQNVSRRSMSLLREVAEHLEQKKVSAALMGAAALPVYGVSRATLDADLVTVDRAVFGAGFWTPLETTTHIDIRKGDQFDPLAGVVRLKRIGERQVDVVVAKYIF